MNSDTKSLSTASGNAVGQAARCKKQLWRDFRPVQCQKGAKRDGYCGVHHPDAVANRRQASEKRFAEKRGVMMDRIAERNEQVRRAECFDDLLAALREATGLFETVVDVREAREGGLYEYDRRAIAKFRAAIAKAEGR